ncbi:MAG: PAS domain S-box protein [Sphingopyxis sp.]|nr:PAS domain S-box protein [Sphingopyxis sp.]
MKSRKWSSLTLFAAVLLALAIFVADSNARLNASVAILYLCVLSLVGWQGSRRAIWTSAAICGLLATISWALVHGSAPELASGLRLLFVLLALGLTAALLSSRLTLEAMRVRLENSEAELINFADSVPQLLWRAGPDGEWDFLNRRFTEITGVERERGIAEQTWRQCVHPDDMGPLREKLARSLESGEDVTHQVRLLHKDGSYRWMAMARRAVRAPDTGEILRFYGGSTDIHEEVLAQEKVRDLMATLEQRIEERTADLLKTEARYASLFDVGNISFAEMDFSAAFPLLERLRADGVTDLRAYMADNPDALQACLGSIRTTRVNRALARLLGYETVEELVANPPAENAEDGAEVLLRQLEMAYYGANHIDGRTTLIGKDGRQIPIYFTVNRIADGLHISSQFSLTEQERIEELRRAAQDELARANRVATVGAYSATIAHELNQPIASMAMDVATVLRWLRADTPNLESAVGAVERMNRTVERVRGIVERTRTSVTAHRRNVVNFDLGELAAETRDLLRPVIKRAGAVLELDCDEDFAAIEADPIELQQVLVNLITNAAEAMHEVKGPRRVRLTIRNEDTGVHVAVADNGPGIAPDQLQRLFEPFFTTKPAGMGMGLQVCRNAVESMGGTLSAGNLPQGGAVFKFVLPVATA